MEQFHCLENPSIHGYISVFINSLLHYPLLPLNNISDEILYPESKTLLGLWEYEKENMGFLVLLIVYPVSNK